MVIYNYPQGFIGQTQARVIKDEVKPIDKLEEKKEEDKRSLVEKRIDNTQDKISRVEDKISRLRNKISSGKSDEQDRIQYSRYVNVREDLQRKLKDLKQEKASLLKGYSKAEVQPKQPQQAKPQEQSVKDVIITPSGFQSKAYDLQTEQEKKDYAKFSSQLTSTKEGVKYGSVPTRTTDRINYYDSTSSVDNKESLSSTIPQSTLQTREEAFGKVTLYQRIIQKQEIAQQQKILNPERAGVYNVKGYFYGAISVPILIFTQPKEFLKGTAYAFTHPLETAKDVGTQLQTQPEFFIGQQIGTYGTFKGIGAGATSIKTQYIKIGSKYVPTEEVFSSQVLTEGKKFPTTTSTEASLQRFNVPTQEGKIIVSTASPEMISGLEAGAGKKASLGLEDSGIYVTPKGEGSPAFLGITKEAAKTTFTFNPIKPVQEFFRTTSVTEFEVASVSKLPREVIKTSGFESIKTFFIEEGSKTGRAYITKRSEIGLGEIAPKEITVKQDFGLESGRLTVRREGKTFKTSNVKSGDIIKEFGTTELEAVVPYSAKFEYLPKSNIIGKIKGFEEYTLYEGKPVAIRRAKLLGESDSTYSINAPNVKEAYAESSSALSSTKYVSPVSSLKSVSVYSPYYSISTPSSTPSSISYSKSSISSTPSIPSIPSSPSSSKLSTPSSTSLISSPSITSTPSTPSTPSYPSTPSVPSYPSTPSTPKPPSVPIVPKFELPSFSGVGETKKKKKESKLYVRKKGKFELKGISEDVGLLFKKGKDIVEQTASASFKVVSDSGQAILPNILPSKFYESKKEKGVAIQKRQFRIGSFGEKQEISYKGLKAQRDRRLI